MLRQLGPLNQRRLTTRIREIYRGEYEDWFALTRHLALTGMSRAEICQQFAALGVTISEGTLSSWIRARERREARLQSEEAA